MTARARAALGERDANHAEITARYEEHFCQVLDLSTVGGGCPDTLVRITTRQGHVLQLVEIKVPGGSLSPSQELFRQEWGMRNCTVVRTVEEVDLHIASVKAMWS
jgi:VRR-NUC domain